MAQEIVYIDQDFNGNKILNLAEISNAGGNMIVEGNTTSEFNFTNLKYFGLAAADGIQFFNNTSGDIWLHNQVGGGGADVKLSSLNRDVIIQTLIHPQADGSAEQIMFTDGSNQLGFKDLTIESTIDPTVNDDFTSGYYFGLNWTNTTTGDQFFLWDGSQTGAALWIPRASGYSFNAEQTASVNINAGGVIGLLVTANVESDPFGIYTHTAGTTDITINFKGRYKIEFSVYGIHASGNSGNVACLSYKNGVLLRKSAGATGWTSAQPQKNIKGGIEIDLNATDVIKFQCVKVGTGTGVVNSTANQCQFLITLIKPML